MGTITLRQLAAAGAGVLVLALGGCGETVPPGVTAVDYQQPVRDTVKVEEHHATQVIFVNARSGAVAPTERTRIAMFVEDFGGNRPESIHVDLHGNGAPQQFLGVVDALAAQGVEREKIRIFPGEHAGQRGARSDSITMAATRMVAVLPNCPGWLDHIAAPGDNRAEANFGCSNASNLGAMVADPADFAKGQSSIYSDAAPAINAVDLYKTDKVKPLPQQTNFSATGGSGSAGASTGGGAGSGGAPQ
ncbi:MAG TPA: CpaD family pilus assembly lipoprotein [Stellaceae bacterium]|nr:CpaD family pilus assembly lipoprotein [Stellaceae bacterium]